MKDIQVTSFPQRLAIPGIQAGGAVRAEVHIDTPVLNDR